MYREVKGYTLQVNEDTMVHVKETKETHVIPKGKYKILGVHDNNELLAVEIVEGLIDIVHYPSLTDTCLVTEL